MPGNALILNRDLRTSHVPDTPVAELELGDGAHPAAWTQLWRFAATFGVSSYAQATGRNLDDERMKELLAQAQAATDLGVPFKAELFELRAALCYLRAWHNAVLPDEEAARVVDTLLDAIYRDVAGGRKRPIGGTGPYEPGLGLGTCSANFGVGQNRFWFRARRRMSRERLYDRVAGKLLREAPNDVVVSALYLYPPRYQDDSAAAPTHVFMLLLEPREGHRDEHVVNAAYDALMRSVVAELASRGHEHQPPEQLRSAPVRPTSGRGG